MQKSLTRIFSILYFLAYGFIYAGWLFSSSETAVFLNYSKSQCVFLLIMTLPFFTPWIMGRLFTRFGPKKILFVMLPAALLLFLIYQLAAWNYYHQQIHLFDPYLQANPVRFTTSQKSENTFRILFLGGSTTQCEALKPQDRYPEATAELLQKKYPSLKIEMLNTGMAWYTSKHSLIAYATYYREWHPDLIIMMHGINDVYRSFSPPDFSIGEYDELWNHFYGPSIRGAKPPSFETHIWEKFRTVSLFGFPLKKMTEKWYSNFRFREINFPMSQYQSLDKFGEYVHTTIQYGRNDGAKIAVVNQPFLYKENLNRSEAKALRFPREVCSIKKGYVTEFASTASILLAMQSFNQKALEIAAEEKVLGIDGAAAVPKDLDHFIDDVHFTATGAHVLAEAVATAIIDSRLLDKQSA